MWESTNLKYYFNPARTVEGVIAMEAIVLAAASARGSQRASRACPSDGAVAASLPRDSAHQLQRAGCSRVVLSVAICTGYSDRFGASFHGLQIDYAIESVPLGTEAQFASRSRKPARIRLVLTAIHSFRRITQYDALPRGSRRRGHHRRRSQPDIARYGA